VDGIDNDQVKELIKITKMRKMIDLPISIGHEDCYHNLITKWKTFYDSNWVRELSF
jgi:hypothetical protein